MRIQTDYSGVEVGVALIGRRLELPPLHTPYAHLARHVIHNFPTVKQTDELKNITINFLYPLVYRCQTEAVPFRLTVNVISYAHSIAFLRSESLCIEKQMC